MIPFVSYREHLDVYRHAIASGLTDDEYVGLVTEADASVTEVGGVGFVQTPLVRLDADGGEVWGKIETANVSGSHKARHLFGLLIRDLVDQRTGSTNASTELAIASCGNAALGAAVVARAAGRSLRVFVPDNANPAVLATLEGLSADVEICHRTEGEEGDPCLAGLGRAIESGSAPFTVQGTLAPHTIDGARTLGLELAAQLREASVTATDLYAQVGGGALGTATMDGLSRAGYPLPRLVTVQTRRAHPFVRAWEHLAPELPESPTYDQALQLAISNPGSMVAWPEAPTSVASGILDDITYDWATLFAHQAATGGRSVLVEEADFVRAADLLEDQVHPPPDETGAASFAGWLTDQDRAPDSVSVVLVTGVRRN